MVRSRRGPLRTETIATSAPVIATTSTMYSHAARETMP